MREYQCVLNYQGNLLHKKYISIYNNLVLFLKQKLSKEKKKAIVGIEDEDEEEVVDDVGSF